MDKKLSTDQQLAPTEVSEWIKQNDGGLQVTPDVHYGCQLIAYIEKI